MKKIEAIIRPYLLEHVRQALSDLNITGMTIYEVRGLGHQQGHTEIYRGAETQVDFLPKIKLEVVVEDKLVEACIDALMQNAHTGRIGDGKIYITDIERVIRIRTGEEDAEAF
ncbi:MAG: P-II family nitrogen regulator [Gammaproteobacteria bacterium]